MKTETTYTPEAIDASIKMMAASLRGMPYGGIADFQTVRAARGFSANAVSLGDIADDLERLRAVLLRVSEENAAKAAELDALQADIAGMRRLLADHPGIQ